MAGMARGATIDGGAASLGVLRDVRRHAEAAHLGDKVLGIVGLVPTQCDASARRQILHHRDGRFTLRRPGGGGSGRIHNQGIAVLHQHMRHVAQLGGLPGRLLEQPGVRIGGRGVRLVAALLAVKVALAIAARCRRSPLPSFGRKLFIDAHARSMCHPQKNARPRAAVHDPRIGQDRRQKAARYVAFQQPIPVLGEHRHVPHRRVHRQPDKPAE